ncbi:TPA: hypothetical protein AB5E20_001602, partial [Vibrio cholerae]
LDEYLILEMNCICYINGKQRGFPWRSRNISPPVLAHHLLRATIALWLMPPKKKLMICVAKPEH